MTKKAPRVRRTAEDARRAILDAAERRLAEGGPAAIRLQDVAADVGVSHPAILHHFGSREGLVEAACERAIGQLEEELVAALEVANENPGALFDRVYETLSTKGYARVMAWLLLSGRNPYPSKSSRANWAKIARATHARRLEATGKDAPYEDTLFTVVLSSLVLFGEAIAGPTAFANAGVKDPARFRAWFGELLLRHMVAE